MIDFRQVASLFINNNEVTELWLGGSKVWEKSADVGPFTIEARTANVTIGSSRQGSPSARDLEYSVDGGETWNTFTLGSTSVTLPNAGDKMMMRGTNSTISNTWQNYWTITFSNDVDVYGNLNSLLGGSETTLTGAFYGLFKGQTHLIDASGLVLPWTTIDTAALGCPAFELMFDHCSYLVGGPELPATTLPNYTYKGMFQYCSNLENSMSFDHLSGALLEGSIEAMFYHASIATPTIDFSSITSIGNNALYESFNEAFQVSGLADFSSITSIGREGLKHAFGGCAIDEIDFSSLTTVNQYQAMYETFWGCPIIKADFSSLTTINAQQAMARLFNFNTSLTRIGEVDENSQDPDERVGCDFSSLTTIDGDRAMEESFKGNTNLVSVEFPSLVRAGGKIVDVGQHSRWTMNAMFKNCTSLESASFPSLTTFGWAANDNMFEGCSSLTSVSFPNLTNCVALWYMFEGCSSIEEVDFPSMTALDDSTNTDAMKHAFYNCSSLERVGLPKLSLVTSGANWDYAFYGCTALEEIDFSQATAVPSITWTSGQHPFTNTNNTFKIVVPDALYDQWIVATNWSDQDILPHIVKYHETCLTFTSQMDGTTISMSANGNAPTLDLEYTKDGLTWSDFTVGSTSVLIDEGEHASFRTKSTTDTVTSTGDSDYNYFVVNGKATLSGSVASMVNKDPFHAKLPEGSNYALNRLFNAQHGIVGSLKNLKLPFKKLEENCYKCMFRDSGGITEAPELPATELASECYHAMFELCTGMTTPCSKLEATDVPYKAYYHMFNQCNALTSAPAISAVNVGNNGMESMFGYCYNLATAIDLSSVDYVEDYGMNQMFLSCSNLPSVDVSNIKTVKFNALQQTFEGCWNLTSVELTSLISISGAALNKTFNDCLKLKTIKFGPVAYVNSEQGTETFKNCWNLDILDLTDVEVAFGFAYPQGMNNSNFHIVVPDSLLSDFQTNWSNVASQIISETEFNTNTSKYVDQTYTAPTQSEIEKGVLFVARRDDSQIGVIKANANSPALGLEYSTDGTNWQDYTIGDTLYFYNAGDKIWFRANQYGNQTWCEAEHDDYYNAFAMRGSIDAYGDVFMLLNQQGASYFNGEVPKRGFLKMFFGGQNSSFNTLKKAPDLTGIVRVNDASMRYMFKQCYGLSGKIDMSNLEYVGVVGCNECFNEAHLITEIEDFTNLDEVRNQGMRAMFNNTSITTAPELAATNLNGGNSYNSMFSYCRSLETAMSVLPATSTSSSGDCYNSMFRECRHLHTAPVLELVTPTSSSGDLLSMFLYCTALESADLGDLASIGNYCCRDAFAYCSNLKHVKLTNLSSAGTNQSNLRMFQYCRKLEDVDCSSATSVWALNNTNAFDCNPYYKIYVPDNLYNSWRGASNWSSIASHIYPASTMPQAS